MNRRQENHCVKNFLIQYKESMWYFHKFVFIITGFIVTSSIICRFFVGCRLAFSSAFKFPALFGRQKWLAVAEDQGTSVADHFAGSVIGVLDSWGVIARLQHGRPGNVAERKQG